MLFVIASANRDEARFPDGDRFDVHRRSGSTSPSATAPASRRGAGAARGARRSREMKRFPDWEVDRENAAHLDLDGARLGTLPTFVSWGIGLPQLACAARTTRRCARERGGHARHRRGGLPRCTTFPSIRDWRADAARAVAAKAGVSERTVYRHFAASACCAAGDAPPRAGGGISCRDAPRGRHRRRASSRMSSLPARGEAVDRSGSRAGQRQRGGFARGGRENTAGLARRRSHAGRGTCSTS